MKKTRFLLLLSLIFFFHFTQAQLIMINGETGEYEYENVVNVEGISQNQIKTRSKEWIEIYYSNIDSVKVGDSLVHSLISKKITWKLIQKGIRIEIFVDLDIKIKDNKYKYSFFNFRTGKINYGELDVISLKTYIERFPEKYQILAEQPIDDEFTKAITSLEYYILNGKLYNNDEDW